MFELLSEQDKKNITKWIKSYAPMNGSSYREPSQKMGELSYILRHWDKAKGEYLGDLFGGQLILSRPYVYHTPADDIWRRISKALYENSAWNRITKFLNESARYIGVLNDIRYGIWELCDYFTYVKNDCSRVFDGLNLHSTEQSFCIDLPNGKKYKVQRNMKPLKLVYKLMDTWAERFDYTDWRKDYEEVRILLSQCTNTAELHGTLCLSIHPMDYMTMSDNDNNWSSCMRWRGNGEYSQGTIEMMNSHTVVVAYLHNPEKPMSLPNGDTWNNKIWRQLFIVDRNFITEVKPYPYDDENITMTCLDWLKDLANNNNPETQFEHYTMEGDGYDISVGENEKYNFTFATGYMYNDLGTMSRSHNIYINLPYWRQCGSERRYAYTENTKYFEIEYSGESECMWCGDYINSDDYDSEEVSGWRVCDDCYGYTTTCACCGRRIYGDDVYYDPNDEPICEYCHDEYYTYDSINGDLVHNDSVVWVRLAKGIDEDGDPQFISGCGINIGPYTYNHIQNYPLLFKGVIHRYENKDFPWESADYMLVDECTEDGWYLFGYDPEYDK